MSAKIKVAPSILSANFGRLETEIKKIEQAGADWIHFDVMDGHFVPNITVGPLVVAPIKKISRLPVDCHLMIENPRRFIESFASAGADIISVHQEVHRSSRDLEQTLKEIRKYKVKPALAINPGTPLKKILPLVKEVAMVLLMTVNPGFGGQKFMSEVLPKIRQLREFINKHNLKTDIEVDGGINPGIAPLVRSSGANVLVAGSAIFFSNDYRKMIQLIRGD